MQDVETSFTLVPRHAISQSTKVRMRNYTRGAIRPVVTRRTIVIAGYLFFKLGKEGLFPTTQMPMSDTVTRPGRFSSEVDKTVPTSIKRYDHVARLFQWRLQGKWMVFNQNARRNALKPRNYLAEAFSSVLITLRYCWFLAPFSVQRNFGGSRHFNAIRRDVRGRRSTVVFMDDNATADCTRRVLAKSCQT